MQSQHSLAEHGDSTQDSMTSVTNSAEYTADLTRSPTSAVSEEQAAVRSHARTMSMATDASGSVKSNRFSVQFPVYTGSTSFSETRNTVSLDSERAPATAVPADGSILTAIATQERRVLELKEDLQRAEVELDKLKRYWVQHEARKKRDDVRRVTQLQPLQTALPVQDKEDDVDGSSAWMQQEMQRRKTLLSGSKSSSRTVFSGSRHTRALSLLTPKEGFQASLQHPRPPRKDSLRKPAVAAVTTADFDLQSGLSIQPANAGSASELPDPLDHRIMVDTKSMDHEALLRQGKKIATDFRDGLWTFWEDLRQATVGEEATNPHLPKRQASSQTLRTARKQSSRNSLRPSSRGSSVSKTSTETKRPSPVSKQRSAALPDLADPTFWGGHGGSTKPSTSTPRRKSRALAIDKSPSNRLSLSSNEAWDTWDDSPAQSRTSSVVSEPNTLPSTVSESPRTSMSTNCDPSDAPRKEPIPWPAIRKVGTATLRRTASHLMQEWENLEKTLAPAPGEEFTGQEYIFGSNPDASLPGPAKPRPRKGD